MFQFQATNENLPPNVIKQLAKELKNLDESPPEGIKVGVNDDDFSIIYADIEGPGMYIVFFFFWVANCMQCLSLLHLYFTMIDELRSWPCSWHSLREWCFPHEVVIVS